MHSFGLITAIMPVLLWFGLFTYLLRVDKKLKSVTRLVEGSTQAPSIVSTGAVKPVTRETEPT
jgi:hypothetical protein